MTSNKVQIMPTKDAKSQKSTLALENPGASEHASQSDVADLFSEDSHLIHMQVLVTGATTLEEQVASLTKAFEKLAKTVEEKDIEIAELRSRLETQDGENFTKQTHDEKLNEGEIGSSKKNDKYYDGSIGSMSLQQLQDIINSSIKAQRGSSSRDSLSYSRPYTKRIANLRMPIGYQPPDFQQFDGSGNPKQHVAHFIETCNNAGTEGDHLVKQFVRSLKGNAFEWYTDLEPCSINSWNQMKCEFLNRFYSTRRTVSLIELNNTKQWEDEPAVDYINRWRSLSLDCKDRLSELSAVEMCIQGLKFDLLYILQAIKPRTFEELATRAHDMELSVASRKEKNEFIIDRMRSKNQVEVSTSQDEVESDASDDE